jgi:hypothetical protein
MLKAMKSNAPLSIVPAAEQAGAAARVVHSQTWLWWRESTLAAAPWHRW